MTYKAHYPELDRIVEYPFTDNNSLSHKASEGKVRNLTSALRVDFSRSTPRLREQYGQFRLSNRTSSIHRHNRYFVTEIGPGLFPSETHEVNVSLNENSEVILASQSATKVHIASEGSHSAIGYRFSVAGGSSLIALQAPTISYEGSKLISTIEVDVEAGSKAIVSELLAKVATTDQSTGSTYVDMMLDINYGGELAFVDRVSTCRTPIHDEIASKEAIGGGQEVVGGIYIVGYHYVSHDLLERTSREMAKALASVEVSPPTSPTKDITLIRARGSDPYAIEALFSEIAGVLTQ